MAIKIKGSSVSGRTPLPADLLERQLAVNTADGYLFTKHSDGTVKDIKTKVADSATTASTCTGNSATVTNGVYTTGDQTIAGVKTFSSSPIAPTPTVGDNTTKVATTAFVKSKSEADSIGVGQTWQDVTASRTLGVTYTNSTGKPIVVTVTHQNGNNMSCSFTINSVRTHYFWINTFDNYGTAYTTTAIVPNGATYSAAGVLNKWMELR
jgi:hypothetical protein